MSFSLIPTAYADEVCDTGSGGINLGNCLRLSDSQAVSEVYNSPAFLVNLIIRNLFVFGGVLLFAMMLYAGFKFAMGGTKGMEEGRKIITTAVLGFMMMFAAYWIVQIIALITGADITI